MESNTAVLSKLAISQEKKEKVFLFSMTQTGKAVLGGVEIMGNL